MTNFGKRLRYLRKQHKHLTQEELSKILNISPSSIGMYERGEREPSYKLLVEIANFFKVSVDYLLDHNPDGLHTFPKVSESDEYLLLLKQEHPKLFQYIETATTDELKKLINILKILQ